MQPHEQRVVYEKKELDGRIQKLNEFIVSNPQFARLPLKESYLMRQQLMAMQNLSKILGQRIALFPKDT